MVLGLCGLSVGPIGLMVGVSCFLCSSALPGVWSFLRVTHACAKHKRLQHVLTSNRNRRITLHNKSVRVSMPHRICQNVTKTNRSNIQTQAGIRHGCVSLEPQTPCALGADMCKICTQSLNRVSCQTQVAIGHSAPTHMQIRSRHRQYCRHRQLPLCWGMQPLDILER